MFYLFDLDPRPSTATQSIFPPSRPPISQSQSDQNDNHADENLFDCICLGIHCSCSCSRYGRVVQHVWCCGGKDAVILNCLFYLSAEHDGTATSRKLLGVFDGLKAVNKVVESHVSTSGQLPLWHFIAGSSSQERIATDGRQQQKHECAHICEFLPL